MLQILCKCIPEYKLYGSLFIKFVSYVKIFEDLRECKIDIYVYICDHLCGNQPHVSGSDFEIGAKTVNLVELHYLLEANKYEYCTTGKNSLHACILT